MPAYLTKSQLVEKLATQSELAKKDVKNVLEALTDVNMRSHKTIPGDEGSLLVTYHNLKLRMDMGRPNLVIGRGEDCDLVVHEKLASRKHVSVRLMRTHFYLVDHSLNGTFVSLESGEEVHVLRKELLLEIGRAHV